MGDTLRVGLIGCGNVVSYGHRPALLTLEDVELVALADVTEARRKIGQEWFGLPDDALYSSHTDVLARADVDAVVITVPQRFRRAIVLDAVAAGKHILSEKPLATTPAVAAELIAAVENAGLTLGMVHNYHFFPEYRQIKDLITARTVGDLRVLTLHYLGVIDNPGAAEYQSDWRHTLAAGGGVLMDMIHAVYLAEWLFGAPAQQVMAFVDAPTYAARQPVIEDLALLQLAYPTGYATIQMGWGQGVGGIDASGSAGHLRLRYNAYQTSGFNQPAELYSVRDWQRTDHWLDNLPTHMDNIGRSFTQLWADFRDAIREQRPTIAPGQAGQRALEVALAGYLSGVTGQVITLPLPTDHPVYQRGIEGMTQVEAWSGSKTRAAGLFGLRDV
ncbi:MAG: Gfo/Idh/MocA family oxidoreductase [Chloroflexi bacterium]|nr:Gfo/Idh/MocA family oxidoreductase [Chloroflexota bacterium]